MSRSLALVLGAFGIALALAGLALLDWRLVNLRQPSKSVAPPVAVMPIPVKPAPAVAPPLRVSTIIDAPGDPALVRRADLKAPRELNIDFPATLSPEALRIETTAYLIVEPLTPASGGYLGKFAASALGADAPNVEIAVENGTDADAGDDDGGDMTPENVDPLPKASANAQQLDALPGGEDGRPQIKQAILRPKITQKISDLLVESGYEATSAQAVETAAKRLYNVQSLRVGAVALAVGAVDPSGVYRIAQLAIYQDGEYVGTVALAESGLYNEGAEPRLPAGFLEESDRPQAGVHYTLADGAYSAGLRSGAPEPVIRQAIQLLQRLVDLEAPLAAGETLRLIYAKDARVKGQPASKVIYIGLSGAAAAADCYAFELNDGSYRCFVPDDATPAIAAPLPPSRPGEAPLPPERPGAGAPADTGGVAVGGLLPPIRGAPVTSLFGMRFHPILHITRLHAGIDFGAAVGSPVRASADGVVEETGAARGYGDRVVLKHGGYETTYNHLSRIMVETGQRVRQGELVALSGNSGLSTGPHLHFEYRVGGEPMDPLPHLGREVGGGIAVAAYRPSTSPRPASEAGEPSAPLKPDPETLAAFAAAKAQIDAALAQ